MSACISWETYKELADKLSRASARVAELQDNDRTLRTRLAEAERECTASMDEIVRERERADRAEEADLRAWQQRDAQRRRAEAAEAAVERLTKERDEAREGDEAATAEFRHWHNDAMKEHARANAAEAALAKAREALRRIENINNGPDRGSGEHRAQAAADIARAALSSEGK